MHVLAWISVLWARTAYPCFRINAGAGCEHVHNHSLCVSWHSVSSHHSSAHSNLFVFRYLKTILQASENIAVLQRQNTSCVTCWLAANLTHHLAVRQAQVLPSLQVSSPGICNNSYRQGLPILGQILQLVQKRKWDLILNSWNKFIISDLMGFFPFNFWEEWRFLHVVHAFHEFLYFVNVKLVL